MTTRADNTNRLSLEEAKQILEEAGQTCSSTDDHIGFVLIVEAHLNNAKLWNYDIQTEHLKVLLEVLRDNETLRKDAAWDIVKPVIKFAFQDTLSSEAISIEGPDWTSEHQKSVHDVAISLLDFLVEEGNPREVFIATTQLISTLSFEGFEEDDDSEDNETSLSNNGGGHPTNTLTLTKVEEASLLMSMLMRILQRIKAKKLSRFLTSCLVPLLALVTRGSRQLPRVQLPILIDHVESFVKSLWTYMTIRRTESNSIDPEELSVQRKLLQAFQTHLVEQFFISQDESTQMIYGNWAIRFDTTIRPEKTVPQRPNLRGQGDARTPARDEENHPSDMLEEVQIIKKMMSLIWDLECEPGELLRACLIDESINVEESDNHDDEDIPEKSEEIPLAPIGSLLILVERQFMEEPLKLEPPFSKFKIFPQHQQLMIKFLLHDNVAHSIIDAILYLGQRILVQYNYEEKALGNVSTEHDSFFMYLQKFAYIATTCGSSDLRYLANLHVANVLSLHPSEEFRVNYFKDTLEHCPFENLKSATITILKDHILSNLNRSFSEENYKNSIFLSPKLLDELLPVLFPNYGTVLTGQDLEVSFNKFMEVMGTIQSTGSFVQVIYTNTSLRQAFKLEDSKYTVHIRNTWAKPIFRTLRNYSKAIDDGKFTFVMSTELPEIQSQINILEYSIERCLETVR